MGWKGLGIDEKFIFRVKIGCTPNFLSTKLGVTPNPQLARRRPSVARKN